MQADQASYVTSSNAPKVVASLPTDVPILFGPDKNLGAYIMKKTGREMELWQGDCYAHWHITLEGFRDTLKYYSIG